jgi:hypothetical protein
MGIWIVAAVIGGVAALTGLAAVFLRYRRGEVKGRHFAALVTGLASFATYALISAFRPDLATGATSLMVLLPAFVAIVVLIREHDRARKL